MDDCRLRSQLGGENFRNTTLYSVVSCDNRYSLNSKSVLEVVLVLLLLITRVPCSSPY